MGTAVTFQRRFGDYLLLKMIAKGGMAEIFRAAVRGPGGFSRLVAVKRILPALSRDARYVDMFINEARLAANLSHANIVQIFDFGQIDKRTYLAMQYVQGKNLADTFDRLLNMGVAAPVVAISNIFVEALYGLAYAHGLSDASGNPLNLIHRDLSPQNIMVSYDGEVKLTDFGIAKAAHTTVQTAAGVVKGKQQYMSPEQIRGLPVDQRSDIFSLGICMYEMLTLKKMFDEGNTLAILDDIASARFVKPRSINPKIPGRLEEILLKALARDAAGRYQSAAEWLEVLEGYLAAEGMRASSLRALGKFMERIFGEALQAEREQVASEMSELQSLEADGPAADQVVKQQSPGQAHIETLVTGDVHPDAAAEAGRAPEQADSHDADDKPAGGTEIGEPAAVGTEIGEPVVSPTPDGGVQSGRTELGEPYVEPPGEQEARQMSLDEEVYGDGESTDELDDEVLKEEVTGTGKKRPRLDGPDDRPTLELSPVDEDGDDASAAAPASGHGAAGTDTAREDPSKRPTLDIDDESRDEVSRVANRPTLELDEPRPDEDRARATERPTIELPGEEFGPQEERSLDKRRTYRLPVVKDEEAEE